MRRSLGLALGFTVIALMPAPASASGGVEIGRLNGSHASMERQNEVAKEMDYSFLRTSSQVRSLVEKGALVPVLGNKDYKLANVSHPAARPITKTFVEQLGRDYHDACGSPLVVTSLTRPLNEQPRNASDLSVHPAGMAVDLRVPASYSCRTWLENELLRLERKGVLDVTRERRPAHYHIAVFPDEYSEWVSPILLADSIAAQLASAAVLARKSIDAMTPVMDTGSAAPTTASIAPGPGTLATILYALVAISGLTALLIVIRGPVAEEEKVRVKVERRRR